MFGSDVYHLRPMRHVYVEVRSSLHLGTISVVMSICCYFNSRFFFCDVNFASSAQTFHTELFDSNVVKINCINLLNRQLSVEL